MQFGMIGLGRMGSSMVQRLMAAGHSACVHDVHPDAVAALAAKGARGSADLAQFLVMLATPRVIWMMLPAGIVDRVLDTLSPLLAPGDIVIDGANSHFHDDLRRAGALRARGLHYVDAGVSGGVWGLERGYCLMIGGEAEIVARLEPLFSALASGVAAAPRSDGATGAPSAAEQGWLHCGPAGAGHFVKMVHNGIEYGLMAAYAEGLNVLNHANAGVAAGKADAETAPLRNPEFYRYSFDIAAIAEVWRRGSVISSWLLDLTAAALKDNGDLASFAGRVSDSGEGRWTLEAAIDEGVPVPVISAALYSRFDSQGKAEFANRVQSAMRLAFGGHFEKPKA